MPAAADVERGAARVEAAELTGAVPAPPIAKVALVTGGGRRIGRALALALAEDGFAVAIHYHHSREPAEAVAAAIRAKAARR